MNTTITWVKRHVWAIAVLLLILMVGAGWMYLIALHKQRLAQFRAARSGDYQLYPQQNSQQDTASLTSLFNDPHNTDAQEYLKTQGWSHRHWGWFSTVHTLSDVQKRGWGEYAWREKKRAAPLWLQSPHAGFDRGTRTIAWKMFEESSRVRGYMANSAPRYATNVARGESDLSHIAYSFFQSAHTAVIGAYSDARIVQLHGFSARARSDSPLVTADAVISNGSSQIRPDVRAIAACLRERRWNVLTYPDDTSELGGTRNRQLRVSFERDFKGFIHLELSEHRRQLLLENKNARKELLSCLLA